MPTLLNPHIASLIAGFFISGSGNQLQMALLLNAAREPDPFTHTAPRLIGGDEMIKTMPDKIATAVGYCTSGSLICWGAIAQWLHDLNWNLIAVIGGFVIGIATFFSNIYFKRQALKAYREAIARGIVVAPPAQDE